MDLLRDLFSSKKFIASITASIIALIATYFELDEAAVAAVVAPFIAYILGQGIADNGKEAVIFDSVAKHSIKQIDDTEAKI